MIFVSFLDPRVVKMRGSIDLALAKVAEKLPDVIFLQANLYADSIHYVVHQLEDYEITKGVNRRIECATCKTSLTGDERSMLIEECIATMITGRNECQSAVMAAFQANLTHWSGIDESDTDPTLR